ncbi:MAG: CBS domain containing-hemolysin-like protein [Cellvibrionaceae bacterium]|jgi:CBS domain containing-hemolysin-like protein
MKTFFSILLLGGSWIGLATILPAEEAVTLTSWLIPISIIVVLIVVNGIFVAAEFAIIGVRPSQLEAIVQEGGDPRAKIMLDTVESTEKQDRYIATAQLGITIASLGLAMYAEPAIEHLLVPYVESLFGIADPERAANITTFAIVLPILTYLHVVIGEMIPKAFSLSNAVDTALTLQGPMRFFLFILAPLITILNWIGNSLLSLMNLPPAQPRPHSSAEIEHLVAESAEGGFIDEDEEEIIRNIFDFSERRVVHVMTPRRKVETFHIDTPVEVLINEVAESTHTRFPIYDRNIDDLVGILHMRDLIPWSLDSSGKFILRELLSPAKAVTENTKVEDMLERFRQEHAHMAIVLDERGGMAGVVTLEDLIEEVVGEVRDEFDVEREPIAEIESGIIEVDGDVLVQNLFELGAISEEMDLPDVETVGGLITTRLGRPAKAGDECTYEQENLDPVTFKVIDVDGLAVTRARIIFEPPPARHFYNVEEH